MKRTTISLSEETLRHLRILAAERDTTVAALIREVLEEKVLGGRPRPRPRSLGIIASGHTDTARLAGEIRPEPRSWR